MLFFEFKDFFRNVKDGGDDEGFDVFRGKGVEKFADKALAANGVFGVVHTLCTEAVGGALDGFLAVGEADEKEGAGIVEESFTLLGRWEAVKKKVALLNQWLLFQGRF